MDGSTLQRKIERVSASIRREEAELTAHHALRRALWAKARLIDPPVPIAQLAAWSGGLSETAIIRGVAKATTEAEAANVHTD